MRQRHGLPRGDLDRITCQQVFMASLASKMLSAKVLADPKTMGKLQKAVSRSVVIDDNWDILSLRRSCATFPAARSASRNDPDRHRGGWSEEGQSIVKVDEGGPRVHRPTPTATTRKERRQGVLRRRSSTRGSDGLAANVEHPDRQGIRAREDVHEADQQRDSSSSPHNADDATARAVTSPGWRGYPGRRDHPQRQLRGVDQHVLRTWLDHGHRAPAGGAARRRGVTASPPRRVLARPITTATDGPMCVN